MRPIFRQWWREYALLNGLDKTVPTTQWYWDGFEHVDPVKEANAQAIKLQSGTTTYSIEYGKQGRDWEEAFEQRAREKAKMDELGLTFTDVAPARTVDDPEAEIDSPTESRVSLEKTRRL